LPGDRPAPTRLQYIDGLRGVAVLIMIEAHVLDAWTRFPDRSTIAYRNLTIVGGFAAPLFLLLAGVALVLSAETAARRQGSRRTAGAAIVARGAQIFILAFLFRLQAFIVTPGSPLVTLFRVDILNVMGPGIALAGVIWMLCPTPWAAALGSSLGATGVAMATPIIRTADWVGTLPIWLQWYMRPAGEHTTFTLFPWVGFVFAGAAVGALIGASRARGSDRAMHAGIATTGAVLVIVGFYAASRPSIYPNDHVAGLLRHPSGSHLLIALDGLGSDAAGQVGTGALFSARTIWKALAVRLLDSRGARIRLRHLAHTSSASYLGPGCRVRRVLHDDVRRHRSVGSPGCRMARPTPVDRQAAAVTRAAVTHVREM